MPDLVTVVLPGSGPAIWSPDNKALKAQSHPWTLTKRGHRDRRVFGTSASAAETALRSKFLQPHEWVKASERVMGLGFRVIVPGLGFRVVSIPYPCKLKLFSWCFYGLKLLTLGQRILIPEPMKLRYSSWGLISSSLGFEVCGEVTNFRLSVLGLRLSAACRNLDFGTSQLSHSAVA